MNTIDKFNKHIMPTYGRYDVVLKKGESTNATDENGKEYIDFGSGIGTNSLGFCDQEWADAVSQQAHTIQHTSNYYYTKVSADFADKLTNGCGYSKLFFANSGAEANECAIKLARKYSYDKYGKGRHNIITLVNSFHGRTLLTLTATGQEAFHNYFFPFAEGFIYAPANDTEALIKLLEENKDTVCAVMFECIQGEGGVIPLNYDYVSTIAKECAKRDILTICDEVQTGVGRTGKFLASEHYGIKPNITTLAKGLAGGIPIGVCMADESCCDVLTKGTHGSTFGGNPICCAGGNVVLNRVMNAEFLDEVAKKGEYIKNELLKMEKVKSVSGLGLMIGIELEGEDASALCKKCLDNGLLVLTAKEKLRLLPPLTITYEQIDKGLKILSSGLEN